MHRTLSYTRITPSSRRLLIFTALLLTFGWLSERPALANGSLDRTFGDGGKARIAIDPAYLEQVPTGMAVRPDGKIIVVGFVAPIFYTPNVRSIALARLNSDGTLDTTFGNGGKVVMRPLNMDSLILSIALQPDGRFVIAGSTQYYIGDIRIPGDLILIRFNDNGSLDSTFGTGGIVTTNIQQNNVQTDLKLQSDGKIVVSGYTYSISTPGGYTFLSMMARYNQNGSLDTTFGSNGIVQLSAFKEFVALVIQSDGKIVAAGHTDSILQTGIYLLARYLTNGSLDSSYGNNGIVTTQVSNGGDNGYGSGINDIVLQPDGKIVAAGSPVIRYLADGSVDPSFAVPFNNQLGYYRDWVRGFGANTIAMRSDGKVVITRPGSIANELAALVGSDGVLIGSTLSWDLSTGQSQIGEIVVQPDNKLLFRGSSRTDDPAGAAFVIARYETITSLSVEIADYYGVGRTYISVYRPGNGTWYVQAPLLEIGSGIPFGTAGDYVCPADYNGDGSSDLVIWRPPIGSGQAYFCHQNSYPASTSCTPWGLAGDIPVVGDFDGDTLADMAVFRQGVWHVLRSVDGVHQTMPWGIPGDKPVPGDYDGDGRTDVAIFRPTNGTWYVRLSFTGTNMSQQFGIGADRLVPGDYDGDGKTDFAVYRNGTWYMQQSTAGFRDQQFGLSTDRPVPGDYDGDGRTDLGVFRDGTWYLMQSRDGLRVTHWGHAGDVPLTVGFVNQ